MRTSGVTCALDLESDAAAGAVVGPVDGGFAAIVAGAGDGGAAADNKAVVAPAAVANPAASSAIEAASFHFAMEWIAGTPCARIAPAIPLTVASEAHIRATLTADFTAPDATGAPVAASASDFIVDAISPAD